MTAFVYLHDFGCKVVFTLYSPILGTWTDLPELDKLDADLRCDLKIKVDHALEMLQNRPCVQSAHAPWHFSRSNIHQLLELSAAL